MAEALAIARQVKDALDAAHETGHRPSGPEAGEHQDHAGRAGQGPRLRNCDAGGGARCEHAARLAGADRHRARHARRRRRRHRRLHEPRAGPRAGHRQADRHLGVRVRPLRDARRAAPAFARATLTDTLAAIVEREPDWSALPHDTPRGVARLLQAMPRKGSPAAAARHRRRRRRIDRTCRAGATAFSGPRGYCGDRRRDRHRHGRRRRDIARSGPRQRRQRPLRSMALTMLPPDDQRILTAPVPSPDGTRLAFIAAGPNGRSALWLRGLGEAAARDGSPAPKAPRASSGHLMDDTSVLVPTSG